MKKRNVVGENLKKMRLRMGLTQEEVALRSGLSQGYINQLENGKRMFTQKSLEQIAKSLNVALVDFFEGEKREEAEGVQEEMVEYRGKRRLPSKKEIIALLNDLPPRLQEHYLTLLRLERDLWKKVSR